MVRPIFSVVHNRVTPRVLSFDDAPHQTNPRTPGVSVPIVGILTSADRFEGMLLTSAYQDGQDATEKLSAAVIDSKFHPQIHAILLDGISFAGLNIVDIARLADSLSRPVVALMRRRPDTAAFSRALHQLPGAAERQRGASAAGDVYEASGWIFQYKLPSDAVERGDTTSLEDIALLLDLCQPQRTTQKIPEGLRIAHLVGAAISRGESSSHA